ncbi:unnamed protein product [Auanema sp. JU1783]|nr:unnamed protein product [Auanema sp. JU1783]
MSEQTSTPIVEFTGFFKALRLYHVNRIQEAEEQCTKLLTKNPLDQAAWALKLACLTEGTYVDELENEDIGIAETFLDQNVIAPSARPGTSFQRPATSAKGANPILRPTTNGGRPLSGVVRPMTMTRPGTMEQAVRTSRTAKTARAMSSSSARMLRLGTASMISSGDGPFINLARLNIDKYASDLQVNRQLFEYVFYVEGDMRVAHQIASIATKAAEFNDWYWKNQLGKCYYRLGMFSDAEKQFLSSLKHLRLVETYAFLAKVACRVDQPLLAIKYYEDGLAVFPRDVTLLTGQARVKEQLNELEDSINLYKEILTAQANNIEAIACIATHYYYNETPEIALRYYRRIMQMGVCNAEVMMNIGLCCFECQQYDFAISSIRKAQTLATEDILAEIWYNVGHIMIQNGDVKQAARCYRLALSADPNHGESMVNLGILSQRNGKKDQARSMYYNAISKNPHLFEAHYNLALLCYSTGYFHECRVEINKALELFPDHQVSLEVKAKVDYLFESV